MIKEGNFDSPLNDAQEEQEKAKAAEIAAQTTDTEKELIKKALSERKVIQQNRSIFERQWLVNIAFLYGKHYFSIERQTKNTLDERIAWELKTLDKLKKTKRSVNYILPLYRSLLSRLLMLKQRVIVDPLTNQQRDISAARVSEEVLEDFWLNVNRTNAVLSQEYCGMMQVLSKAFQYMLICGKAYLKPTYNPNAKAKILFENMANKPIINAPVGAVEVEVDHPFNVFVDPMKRYWMQKKILSVDYIEEMYGVKVSPEEVGLSDVEKQLMTLLEGGQDEKYKNAAEIIERWELPSPKNPEGRLYVFTKDVMLVKPQPLPPEYNGRIPSFELTYLDIMFAHPQGVIEQLIPSQEEYNHTVTRLHEYKKWMAGKILVPDGCNLSTKYDDQVGQIVKYDAAGGEPKFDSPPNPPSFIMQEIPRIRRDMEDIAATHDATQGRTPKGVTANSAIQSLSELDQSQLSPQLLNIETQLSFFCDMVLDIVEKKYNLPRLIGITGKNLAQDVRTFLGDNVAGNRRIRISLGTNLPVSREARQETIAGWLKAQLITREEAREMLEFGNLDGVYHSIDDQAEKTEIQELLKGIYPEPQQWENHTRRIKVLTDFMMSEDFVELMRKAKAQDPKAGQIVQGFMQHRQAHQAFLQAEMQAMQTATAPGAAPQPPAAA